MKELVAALDKALAGDAAALAGFGVQQALFVRAGWEDTLSVDGDGVASYSTHGSDRLGDDVGLYRATLSPEELKPLLLGAKQLALASLKPVRAEAYDSRMTIAIVCGGHSLRFTTSSSQPASMQQLDPVMLPLQRALMKALQHPVRALSVGVAVPQGVLRSGPSMFLVTLHNAGTEGMWVPNPATLPNAAGGDRIAITWAAMPVQTPGVTQVPVTPQRAMLTAPAAGERPPYLWVPGKSDVAVPMQASLEIPPDLKEIVLGAELVAVVGEDFIAGRPRFRGSLLSADVVAQPR